MLSASTARFLLPREDPDPSTSGLILRLFATDVRIVPAIASECTDIAVMLPVDSRFLFSISPSSLFRCRLRASAAFSIASSTSALMS